LIVIADHFFTRHPGGGRGPALDAKKAKLDSGFRRNDDADKSDRQMRGFP
jgi:hypothetical protein